MRVVLALILSLFMFAARAGAVSSVGAEGYDLTTYFTQAKPQRGTGHHVAVYKGVSYLFMSEENKKMFEADPAKYLPQYDGYCAYGASVGKKFVPDPEAFDVVDGKLYLNLDAQVRAIWLKDVKDRISAADEQWKTIADKSPAEL